MTWSGSPVVGPGLTTFFTSNTGTAGFPADVKTLITSWAGNVPTGVTWTVPISGDLIDDGTGGLSGTWSVASGGGTVVSSAAGSFASGVGCRIRWGTDGVVGGRRVVGSTFVVPLAVGAYQSDGTILDSVVTALSAAAVTFRSRSGGVKIFSRPIVGRLGSNSNVIDSSVPDKVSWLRSRRT